MSAPKPMTEERLKEVEARAAEHVLNAREAYQGVWTDAETLAGEDVPALVAEVRRLQGAMVEIRRHISGACGHGRRPDKIGACLTAMRDLTFGEPSATPGGELGA